MLVKNLLNSQILTEMPQLIGSVDFGLNNPKYNHELCVKLNRKAETLFDYQNLEVRRSGAYIYAKNSKDVMPYVIKTEKKNISALGKVAIIQRGLWRNLTSSNANGLPAKVFFDVLLHENGLVASDCQQSEAGRRFWQLRLYDAIKKGHYCYFLEANPPRKMVRLLGDNDSDDVDFEASGKIWGKDASFKTKWLLISVEPLEPKGDVKFDGN